jgi:spermidine synthase
MRFYEINAEVVRIARSRFHYLEDSPANIEISLGDARLSMERELKREPEQQFDVLVLDAFSSDAIPVHLLTRESVAIYLRHLKPDGVLAVHISNRYLNLQPIVVRLAAGAGLRTAIIDDSDVDSREEDEESSGAYSSDWVLLSKNKDFLNSKPIFDASSEEEESSPKIKAWTDEKSDLFHIVMVDEDTWFGWLVGRLR